jgi:Tfp pilus assembly protein PilV
MHIFRMPRKRGFTLFTALLSIVLISLTWLLMSSMTNTEKSAAATIDDVKQHDEMQAIIDLKRADAMQVFNFNLRKTTEEYLTEQDSSGMPINAIIIDSTITEWEDVKFEFSRFFASRATGEEERPVLKFATITSQHLSNLIERTESDVRGYAIDLANYTIDCTNNRCEMKPTNIALFRERMQETFEKQLENDSFIEDIKCSGSPPAFTECLGTFYINMDLSEAILSESSYQDLPKVKITHRSSGRALIEPILPRGIFRIYVPIRYFRALAGGFTVATEGLHKNSFRQQVASLRGGPSEDCRDALDELRQQLTYLVNDAGDEFRERISSTGDFEVVEGSNGSIFSRISLTPEAVGEEPECEYRVSHYGALLVYEEKNPRYRVYADAEKGHRYGILIQDRI